MHPLSARDLLLVWEQAERQPPLERGLVLLAAACPDLPEEELVALPLGRREAQLFHLYQETFGPELDLAAECPACGDPLEISVRIEDLETGREEQVPERLELQEGGLRLLCRPPDGADLDAAAACGSAGEARRLLVERCVLEASRDGVALAPSALEPAEVGLLSRGLAAADPRAEVVLDLACPACGHLWQALLDAADCLWHEIDAAARRLLREVHALARGYGWREADILAMSARRRRRYLELLAG